MNRQTHATRRRRSTSSSRRRGGTSRRARERARRRTTIGVSIMGAVVAVGVIAIAVATDRDSAGGQSGAAAAPEGVVDVAATSRNHVSDPVDYQQNPPAGGDHAPAWQNCGFYDEPIPNEAGVHSLEHGAVWIQYSGDLPQGTRDNIKALTDQDPYLLASSFDDLQSPIVLSAWGKQFEVDTIDDPRVAAFLESFVQGPQTPEPGAVCTSGVGQPAA